MFTAMPNAQQSSLHQQVIKRVEHCLSQASSQLQRSFTMPTVNFNQRGRIAGSAWLNRWELRFNPILLADNETAFMQEVIPHEVAHLVTFACFGKVKPHGKEWQHIMRSVFNLTPRTRHQLDTSKVAATFLYHCDCQVHHLSLRRHNKVQRRQQRYQCVHCQQVLAAATT